MDQQDIWVTVTGCALWAYIIGSVNLTIWASRLLHLTGIEETGSKNPGVTNLFRVAGVKIALPVLLLELSKAVIAFLPAVLLGIKDVQPLLIIPFLMGNLFPLLHGFRGGKGVAATVGALLVVDFRVMLLGGLCFIGAFAVFRRVSVGSLFMVLSYSIFIYIFHGFGTFFDIGIVLAVMIAITHRSNIKRLISGEEPQLTRSNG